MNDVSILVLDRQKPYAYAAVSQWMGRAGSNQAMQLAPDHRYMMIGTMEIDDDGGGKKFSNVINALPEIGALIWLMLDRLEKVRRTLGTFGRDHLAFDLQTHLNVDDKALVKAAAERFVKKLGGTT